MLTSSYKQNFSIDKSIIDMMTFLFGSRTYHPLVGTVYIVYLYTYCVPYIRYFYCLYKYPTYTAWICLQLLSKQLAHTMKLKSHSKYFHNKISIKQLKPKFRRGIHVYMMPNKFYIKSSHKNKMFKKCRRV